MDLKTKTDKYIEGLLSENERLIFEEEMKNNLEIEEYFKKRKLLNKKLSEYFQANISGDIEAEEDIRKYLHTYENDNKNKEKEYLDILKKFSEEGTQNRLFSKSFLFNLAAAIALLIIIGIGFSNRYIQHNTKEKYANIFAQYFEPEKDFHFSDSISNSLQNQDYLMSQEFNPAQLYTQFNSIVRSGSYNEISLVYISILLIQKGEEDKALKQLEDIMLNAEINVYDISRWYYSLLNLKIGETNISLENLRLLCKGTSSYSERACLLINEIAEN